MDGETKEADQDERDKRDERWRRIERLGALAAQQAQPSQGQDGTPELAPPAAKAVDAATPARGGTFAARTKARSGRRFWLSVGAAALAVCVVAAGTLVWLHQMHPAGQVARPIPDPLAILLDPQFSCPTEVAWSPDGTKVAVLGFQDCPSNNGTGPSFYQYGMINVYDTRRGGVLSHIQLDAAVTAVAAPHATTTAQGLPNVLLDYSDLIWSPDGRRLAVQYGIVAQETGSPRYAQTDLGTGLLLADPAKGAVQVMPPLAALPAENYGLLGGVMNATSTQAPPTSFQPVTALRWDLASGTGSVVQVPQAASYAWSADGTLQPSSALPASPDATPGPASQGAIGNADGGASFSMWQAGAVSYPWHCTNVPFNGGTSFNCCPVTAYYTASLGVTSAWSPDGRYLVQTPAGPLGANGKIAQALAPSNMPTPANSCANPAQAASLAQLPVRDPALVHTLSALEAPELNSATPIISGANVAWSPDGRRLAVGYSTDIGVGTSSGVTVYNCVSGTVLATISSGTVLAPLSADERARDPVAAIAAMAWSPDSQRLLVFDPSHGVLLILGPKSLGGTGK